MGYGNIEISRQSASALRVLKPDSERKTKTEKKQKKDLCSELDCSSQPVPEIRQKTRRVPEGGIQLTRVRTGTRNVFSLKGNQTNQTSRALSNRNRIFFLIDIHTASGLYSAQVQCCFSSTKTVGTIRDGEPRTTTSTFTQLLGCIRLKFSVALRPQRSPRTIWKPRTAISTFTQLLNSVSAGRQPIQRLESPAPCP